MSSLVFSYWISSHQRLSNDVGLNTRWQWNQSRESHHFYFKITKILFQQSQILMMEKICEIHFNKSYMKNRKMKFHFEIIVIKMLCSKNFSMVPFNATMTSETNWLEKISALVNEGSEWTAKSQIPSSKTDTLSSALNAHQNWRYTFFKMCPNFIFAYFLH